MKYRCDTVPQKGGDGNSIEIIIERTSLHYGHSCFNPDAHYFGVLLEYSKKRLLKKLGLTEKGRIFR